MASRTSRKPKPPIHTTICVEESYAATPFNKLQNYWIFGPHTQHPWPSGDFYDAHMGIMESAWPMAELLTRRGVVRYDPDCLMDVGL